MSRLICPEPPCERSGAGTPWLQLKKDLKLRLDLHQYRGQSPVVRASDDRCISPIWSTASRILIAPQKSEIGTSFHASYRSGWSGSWGRAAA